MKNSKKVMKWINLISFGVLLVGGINFLLMGLFEFDLFAAIFGGAHAVVPRIMYSLFGFAALALLGSILWKALMTGEKKSKQAATQDSTEENKTQSQSKKPASKPQSQSRTTKPAQA